MHPHTVLYVHNSSNIAGGNKVLLSLFDRMDRTRFRPISILPAPGPMEDELRARAVSFWIAPIDRALATRTRIRGALASAAILRVMLVHRPGIIHANGVLVYRYAGIAGRLMEAVRICHIHLLEEAKGSLEWAFKTLPHAVLTPTHALAADVSALLASDGLSCRVVPVVNAVNTDRFEPTRDRTALRKELGLAHFSHLISIVGVVSERKGHSLFLHMAQRILSVHPKAGFLIVGEDILGSGAYRRRMEGLANELGIAKQVVFTGFASETQVRDFLAASDVATLPSYEEGFGLSLAEAQACGVPVVSTRLGPISEVVADGITGTLVSPGDLDAFSAATLSFLGDEKRRSQMGREARDRTVRLFGVSRYVREIESLYQNLLNGK